MTSQCEETICYTENGWPRHRQCSKVAVTAEEGKNYCRIHAPSFLDAKRKKRHQDFEERWEREKVEAKQKALHLRIGSILIRSQGPHYAVGCPCPTCLEIAAVLKDQESEAKP